MDLETMVIGNPFPLKQNAGKSFQGSIVLGKGFVLSPEEAGALIAKDPRNKDVLFPYLNGDDLNNDPEQKPSRWVINFFDWSEEKARTYPDCFEIVERLVKPERKKQNDKGGRDKWWLFLRPRNELYMTISQLDQVMVSCRVSKYVNQSLIDNNCVFDVTTTVIARSSLWEYAFLQNSFHVEWAWKYASTMKGDIRYINGGCIDTFPFPINLTTEQKRSIEEICKEYLSVRSKIMSTYKIGLTKVCNQFHNFLLCNISEEDKNFEKKYEKEILNLRRHFNKHVTFSSLKEVYILIVKLRKLQEKLDYSILAAYEWTDINLKHDFYEIEYLPESDRIRFTIHPDARREILSRLLFLNHDHHNNDASIILEIKKKTRKTSGTGLFSDFDSDC